MSPRSSCRHLPERCPLSRANQPPPIMLHLRVEHRCAAVQQLAVIGLFRAAVAVLACGIPASWRVSTPVKICYTSAILVVLPAQQRPTPARRPHRALS